MKVFSLKQKKTTPKSPVEKIKFCLSRKQPMVLDNEL